MKQLPYLKIYWFVISRNVLKLCYLHTGFDDRCFIWIVKGELMDFFWFKIKTKTT